MAQSYITDARGPRDLFSEAVRWIVEICVVISFALLLIWCFGVRVEISGHSMEPSMNEGDVVLLDRVSYRLGDVDRFDAVGYMRDDTLAVKRVVGLPGETVQIVNGTVLIDGEELLLPDYMSSFLVAGVADAPVTVGENEYFLLGDNGESSEDSRFYTVGNVARSEIRGRVWFRIAPFKDIGRITK